VHAARRDSFAKRAPILNGALHRADRFAILGQQVWVELSYGVSYTLLCYLVFGELCGREFAALDVACVDLRKLLPLLGQVIQRENRRHRADRHTGATVDALDGIDVELRDFIEAGTAIIVGRALLGVDAIYGAGIDAAVSFTPMQGSAMTYVIGHLLLPRYASWSGDSSDAGRKLLGYP
jgi:hypothetical protein